MLKNLTAWRRIYAAVGAVRLEQRVKTFNRHRYGIEHLEQRVLLSGTSPSIELFNTSAAVFVENQGQWTDSSVHYGFQGSGASIAFTDTGLKFVLTQQQDQGGSWQNDPSLPVQAAAEAPPKTAQFSVSFDGAKSVVPVGQDQAETTFDYFIGDQSNWHINVGGYTPTSTASTVSKSPVDTTTCTRCFGRPFRKLTGSFLSRSTSPKTFPWTFTTKTL